MQTLWREISEPTDPKRTEDEDLISNDDYYNELRVHSKKSITPAGYGTAGWFAVT